MPTYQTLPPFDRDWKRLTSAERARFRAAVSRFIADLNAGGGLRKGLRVKRVQGTAEVWEMTWAPNGRATWQYGPEIHPGRPHIIWRRVGTHDVLDDA